MRASESPAKAPAATASTTPTPPLSPTSECNGRSSGLACDDDGVPEPGTTAVVIGLPDATPLLDAAWRIDPALVRRGVPAHVSLLYPFVPESALTVQDEKGVRSLAASFPAADLLLEEIVTASGFVAVSVPGLQAIVDAFHARWPGLRPYSGRFGARPAAHVTVAMGADNPTAAAAHPCGGGRAGGADGGRLAVKVHRTARRPGRTVNTPAAPLGRDYGQRPAPHTWPRPEDRRNCATTKQPAQPHPGPRITRAGRPTPPAPARVRRVEWAR